MQSMIKKFFLFTALSIFLAACGSQTTKNTTDYEHELQYPKKTANLVFKELKIYDDPLYGAGLSYVDPEYPTDLITLYIYPIPATEWEDEQASLQDEMNSVIEELNYAYVRVSKENREPFSFEAKSKKFSGLKASFNTWMDDDTELNSNAYLFIAEDKFVKFRTSFHALLTPDWNGDHIVQEILPELIVPPESPYMHKLRAEHREAEEQRRQGFLNLIMQAVEENKKENQETEGKTEESETTQ